MIMHLHLSHLLAVALGMMIGGGVAIILAFLCIGNILTEDLAAIKELLELKL